MQIEASIKNTEVFNKKIIGKIKGFMIEGKSYFADLFKIIEKDNFLNMVRNGDHAEFLSVFEEANTLRENPKAQVETQLPLKYNKSYISKLQAEKFSEHARKLCSTLEQDFESTMTRLFKQKRTSCKNCGFTNYQKWNNSWRWLNRLQLHFFINTKQTRSEAFKHLHLARSPVHYINHG